MTAFSYQLVNVFAESRWGGNPLAVFTDASGLSDADMQAIARQFNLSETVFVLPGTDGCAAALRIFTPALELPFAGHPLLGSAAVLQKLLGLPAHFSLNTRAGEIAILEHEGIYRLCARPATSRAADLDSAMAAAMLGLDVSAMAAAPVWVNAGSEQLLLRAASRDAVLAAKPDPLLFAAGATLFPGRSVAYLWHAEDGVATVRLFYGQGGAVLEDPGTGSACANLGAWCVEAGMAPLSWRVVQGEAIGRPNILYLDVDAAGRVEVGGRVQMMGQGVFCA
ncbi:PhzF family phenazine biosynthesis protein [Rhodobacteraceae bacterium CH30]|nr:PhzF family phenazine biosynthesis protein [Rhodobacteraceae bacterium CH30]